MSEHQLRQKARIRTAFEVRPLLNKIAAKIGELHGVVLGVQHTPSGLFFVNGIGEIVQDGPIHVLCCTDEEIATGDFIKFFTPRCFYASMCEALAQDYVQHQLGGIN